MRQKWKITAVALLAMCLMFAACGQIPPATAPVPNAEDTDIPFAAHIVEFSNKYFGEKLPPPQVITTADELEAFRTAYAASLHLGDELFSQDLAVQLDSYDHAFFQDNALLLAWFDEPSCSTSYEVLNLALQDNQLTLTLLRQVPELGLAAIASWAVCVEFDPQYAAYPPTVVVQE